MEVSVNNRFNRHGSLQHPPIIAEDIEDSPVRQPASSPPPALPSLSMIVDRTSFDETDDYGVNVDALQKSHSAWTDCGDQSITSTMSSSSNDHKRVMKNGKVRRRLRWRPRKPVKLNQTNNNLQPMSRTAAAPVLLNAHSPVNSSCGASVTSNSNASQNSKQSRKSVHSFASTETLKKNNTLTQSMSMLSGPLPRPNYNDSFSVSEAGVATIGTEGNYVHARMRQQQEQHQQLSSSDASVVVVDEDGIENIVTSADNMNQKDQRKSRTLFAAADWNYEGLDTIPDSPMPYSEDQLQTPLQANRSNKNNGNSFSKPPGMPPLFKGGKRRKSANTAASVTSYDTNMAVIHTPVVTSSPPTQASSQSPPFVTPPRYRQSPLLPQPSNSKSSQSKTHSNSNSPFSTPPTKHSSSSGNQQHPSPPTSGNSNGTQQSKNYSNTLSASSSRNFNRRRRNREDSSPFDTSASISSRTTHTSTIPLAQSIPSLGSDDFESERRVDLRIPMDVDDNIDDIVSSVGDSNADYQTPLPSKPREVLSLEDLRPSSKQSPGIPEMLVIKHDEEENTPMVILDSMSSDDADDKSFIDLSEHHSRTFSPSPSTPLRSSPVLSGRSSTAASPEVLLTPVSNKNRSIPDASPPSGRSEMRFSMMERRKDVENTPESNKSTSSNSRTSRNNVEVRTPPSPRKTGPVDIDDGSFLEAEKNLHAIHAMATEHLKHGEYSEALEVFEEILRGQLARYGPHHFRVGTALHNIGIVHMKRGDYTKAVKVCRDAVTVRKEALGSVHPDVAVSLAQLGVVYLEMKRHKKAIVCFREALRIRRHCLGPSHPKVAKILNNIGCALYELNELEVAKIAFEEALDVQRENLRDIPGDEESVSAQQLLSIASTLCNIGSIKLYWGQYEDASVDLEDALLLQQSVLGDTHPVSRRTEESLEWIEKTKKQADSIVSPLAEGILLTLSGISAKSLLQDSQRVAMACTSPMNGGGIFNALEQKVMDWHEQLDIQCGAMSPQHSSQITTVSI